MPVDNELKQLLRDAGYKATPPRLAVLRLLYQLTKPVTAADVLAQLKKEKLDEVTVYRTLTLLVKIGLVKQISFEQGVAYYERTALGDHHHVVCTQCHRVEDVQGCCIEEDMTAQALKQSGFAHISRHALEFFGLCKQCRTSS